MSFTQIEYEKRGAIAIIRFNRPAVLNCIGPTTHRELVQAWSQFREDDEAWVAVITDNGNQPR